MSDKDVLQALHNDDKNSFEKIYRIYKKQLYGYLNLYTKDKQLIEDLIQDTMISLWLKRRDIVIKTSLKSYLFRMAYNNWIEYHRCNIKITRMLSGYEQFNKTENEINGFKENDLEKLETCLCMLPPKCKDVFIANKMEGLKYKDVAVSMNISMKTVENHVAKAFRVLRGCMVK